MCESKQISISLGHFAVYLFVCLCVTSIRRWQLFTPTFRVNTRANKQIDRNFRWWKGREAKWPGGVAGECCSMGKHAGVYFSRSQSTLSYSSDMSFRAGQERHSFWWPFGSNTWTGRGLGTRLRVLGHRQVVVGHSRTMLRCTNASVK